MVRCCNVMPVVIHPLHLVPTSPESQDTLLFFGHSPGSEADQRYATHYHLPKVKRPGPKPLLLCWDFLLTATLISGVSWHFLSGFAKMKRCSSCRWFSCQNVYFVIFLIEPYLMFHRSTMLWNISIPLYYLLMKNNCQVCSYFFILYLKNA